MPKPPPIDFADPDPPESRRSRPPSGPGPTMPPVAPKERACPGCGKQVAGSPPPPRCPRCGGLMDAGLPDLLQHSSPEWVAKLATGAFLMAWVPAVHILATILSRTIDWRIGSTLHTGAEVMLCVGAWLVTTREPADRVARDPAAPWVRGMTVTACLAWTAAGLLLFGRPGTAYWIALYSCLILSAAEAALVGTFLRTLCVRIPDDASALAFQNFAWMVPAICGFFIVAKILFLEQWIAGAFFISFPIIGALCFLLMWVARYLIRMGVDLKEVVIAARQPVRIGPREPSITPQITVFPTSRGKPK